MITVQKKKLFIASAAAAALTLSACGGTAPGQTGTGVNLVIAGTLPSSTAMIQGAERIATTLAEQPALALSAEVYPDGQLGGEPAMLEALITGTVDIAMVGAPLIATYCPSLGATSLPYVIAGDTPEQQQQNLLLLAETEVIAAGISECAKSSGYRVLTMSWWYGNRHVTSNTPINTPDDLRGLRIRTPEGALHADPFRVLGAEPVPMAQSEVYTALETGVIAGQENPFATAYLHSFYEVQDYVNLTALMTHTQVLVMNENKYSSLTADQQEALTKAIDEAGEWQSAKQLEYNKDMRQKLVDVGMTIIEPDLDAFRSSTENFVQEYCAKHGIDLEALRQVQK